jgi:hypothetical protein
MSVGNTNFQNTYTTDGTAGPWAFNWVYTEEIQVQVYLDLVLQSPSTYSVTKDLVNPGGTISFNAGSVPILGKALLIQRFANTLQTDSLGTNQELPPATLVRMADKLTIIAQQLSAQILRSLAVPLTTIGFTATLPTPIAGAIPVVNAANNAVEWIAPIQAGLALIDQGVGNKPIYGPVTSAAGGNVIGSGVSAVDNLVAFNNAGSSAIKDSGISKASVAAVVSAANALTHHGGRLSVSNIYANPTADQSGTTLYLLPYMHDKTYVYVGGSWVQRTIVAQSLSISSGVFRLVDIFEYDNAGALALEALPWDSSGQLQYNVTSASKASPCVLTIGSHSLVVGDIVGIYAAAAIGTVWTDVDRKLHGKKCYVSAKTGTTITLEGMDTTGLTTSNYTGVKVVKIPTAPNIGLALQDGVAVKSGDATRRFLGTLITDGDGNIVDSTAQRNLSNWYNRANARLYSNDAVSSFVSANTSSWIARDASTQIGKTRCELVTCFDQSVLVNCRETWDGSGINWFPGIGANRLDPAGTGLDFTMQVPHSLNLGSTLIMAYSKVFSRGSTFLQHMNYGNGTTGLGDTGNSNRRSGFDFVIQR